MTIRDFRQADFKKGLLECLNALSETRFTKASDSGRFARERKARGVRTFVMATRGPDGRQVVVGTYSVIVEPKFLHGGSWVGHVEDVCVHPDWQGQGVGKALVDHAVNFCRHANCYKVVLHCSQDLIPFYERAGFYYNGCGMRLDIDASEEKD